jgi:hypothetical protein
MEYKYSGKPKAESKYKDSYKLQAISRKQIQLRSGFRIQLLT